MSRVRRWALPALAAVAILILGLAGAYGYGEAYWQHRGFAPLPRLPHARVGRLLTVHFYSPALQRRSDYLVYLPPGYSRARRYPVYYLLHGAPGGPQDFISVVSLNVLLSNRLSQHELRPMILALPDGRINGDPFSDSEWANTPAGNYESYVLDVVRDVDHRFAAIPSRRARVIAGYSMGGYGALNVALHHPSVFGNVQSWSGYFVQTRKFSTVFAHASRAELAYNSPLDYAPRLTRAVTGQYPLRVYMFTGRSDHDGRGIGKLAAELRRAGVIAGYNRYPGGHDWQVWYSQVDPMMLMASRMVTHPLPVVSRPRFRRAGPGPRDRARALHGRPAPTSASRTWAAVPPVRLQRGGIRATRPHSVRPGHGLTLLAWLGLMLALLSAALINLGFLLQQRGLVHGIGDGLRAWRAALHSRTWLAGQAIGWLGFAVQVLAVGLAPLSLVQAFAAGGLALSVPLAAGIFGHRVPRLQVMAVTGMAAGLFVLSLGAPRPGAGMSTGAMICATALVLAAGAALNSIASAVARAVGAGLLYGVADAAIKAIAVAVRAHGASGVLSGWTVLAAVSTFSGFLAFQAALRRGNAVTAISLMTVLTTLTALLFGLLAFHESLGAGTAVTILHLTGIALVLSCVPALVDTNAKLPATRRDVLTAGGRALGRAIRALGAIAGVTVASVTIVLTGTGLLSGLRGLGWLPAGPRIADALPLLQLARFDGQPLARVAVAWLLAGAVFGLALIRIKPVPRVIIAGGLGLVLLLFASEASFALTRNLRLSAVLSGRVPGAGAWIEAGLLAAGTALPRPVVRARLRLPQRTLQPVVWARQQLSSRAN